MKLKRKVHTAVGNGTAHIEFAAATDPKNELYRHLFGVAGDIESQEEVVEQVEQEDQVFVLKEASLRDGWLFIITVDGAGHVFQLTDPLRLTMRINKDSSGEKEPAQ